MRRDISTGLKELRLHGMAGAWDELTTQEGKPSDVGVQGSRLVDRAFATSRTRATGVCLGAPPNESGQIPTSPGSGGL